MTEKRTIVYFNIKRDINEDMTVKEIASKYPPLGWKEVFNDAFEDISTVSDILEEEENKGNFWYPLKKDIFSAFYNTRLNNVNVVFIGQDPYPNIADDRLNPRANGLCFSVNHGDSIPVSLKNIFSVIQNEYGDYESPIHGNLRKWAHQGILMLNKCLTVRCNEPGSHKQIWEGFIYHVIKAVSHNRPNAIFVLFGKEALDVRKYIEKNPIIELPHPASRGNEFLRCDFAKKINQHLFDNDLPLIDWCL